MQWEPKNKTYEVENDHNGYNLMLLWGTFSTVLRLWKREKKEKKQTRTIWTCVCYMIWKN